MESYRTSGTCARQIIFDIKDEIITELKFVGGCSGNLQAIARLCTGKHIDEVVECLQNIKCQNSTSCPDQLAKALIEYKNRK